MIQLWLVVMKNVWTLVLVLKMLNVRLKTTEAFALAYQTTEVILILEAVNQVRPNIFLRFDKYKSIHILFF